MREDDDAPQQGTADGSLADGLGETAQPGEYSSTSEPYGDGGIDDTYGEDSYDDDAYGDESTEPTDSTDGSEPDDTTAEDTSTQDDDGGYGDGESGDDGVVIYDDTDDTGDSGAPDDGSEPPDGTGFDDDLLAQDASPLEGVGFLIDEVRDALFGDDDEAAASAVDGDPADLATDTDLDLTGDGVVDSADLHEAESPLDFDVDLPHP